MSTEINPFAQDLDTVRDILLWMEKGAPRDQRPCMGDDAKYCHHMGIMNDAGLIKAALLPARTRSPMKSYARAEPVGILPLGYAFLTHVKDQKLWEKVKQGIQQHVLPALLSALVKKLVE